jgi:hypothetical protein
MSHSMKDSPIEEGSWLSDLTEELERKRQNYEDSFAGFNAYLHWLNTLDFYVTHHHVSGRGAGWFHRLPPALKRWIYALKTKKCSRQNTDDEAQQCFVQEFILTQEDQRIMKNLIARLRNKAGIELLERWKNEPEPAPDVSGKWDETERIFGVDVPHSR